MTKNILFSVLITLALVACDNNVETDFSFTPENPKIGQKVNFKDLTFGDTDWKAKSWNWEFGDNGTSLMQNPTYIYKKPGVYTVKLMVDSAKRYIKERQITVYDSIPTIVLSTDTVRLFRTVTFSTLTYNPTGAAISYEWNFPSSAQGSSLTTIENSALKKATASTVTVFFDKLSTMQEVKLKITVGTTTYDVKKTFEISDDKTKSMVIAPVGGGSLAKQRIYENGLDQLTTMPIQTGKHTYNLHIVGDQLIIFNAGSDVSETFNPTTGDGSIIRYNLRTNTNAVVINNDGKGNHHGFFNGFADKNNIYWTDYTNFVYRTPINASHGTFTWRGNEDAQAESGAVPYYLAKTNRLGYFEKGLSANHPSTGIYYYDMAYFWAKGGAGRGIFRFMQSDILTANATGATPIPTLGAILTDFAIRAFTIDEINRMIYFSVTAPADKIGLWVAGIDGSNPRRFFDGPMINAAKYITGIAIDHESNVVYWAYNAPSSSASAHKKIASTHTTGIKRARLARQFQAPGAVENFINNIAAYGIAIDHVKR